MGWPRLGSSGGRAPGRRCMKPHFPYCLVRQSKRLPRAAFPFFCFCLFGCLLLCSCHALPHPPHPQVLQERAPVLLICLHPISNSQLGWTYPGAYPLASAFTHAACQSFYWLPSSKPFAFCNVWGLRLLYADTQYAMANIDTVDEFSFLSNIPL